MKEEILKVAKDLEQGAINEIEAQTILLGLISENKIQKVKAIQDESSHWYVIPNDLVYEFRKDEQDENFVDSGRFDNKYGKYRTGGDLNLVQLYIRI